MRQMGHGKRKANPQLKARTTRSSRGRLLSLSDPAHTSQLLDDQLRQLGLYAANTIGDGNCLFRALSDQLHGTDSKHAQLRQHICDWIQNHKARYEPFVEDERGIDTHLRCMRENATYGGHMELSAFAHMAHKNVKVVQPGLVYVIEWQAFASSPTSDTKPPPFPDKEDDDQYYHQEDDTDGVDSSTIYVAYHDWEHFSSIRNLKGPHVGLPRVEERPAPAADAGPSPVPEDYKPAKERKKAEKERERERKERKREKARGKTKYSSPAKAKGKQRASLAAEDTDSAGDEDEMEDVDEEDPDPEPVEPEKLKIKLKLTLNSNPSSANISESETTTRSNSASQRTGLKLRLPPSRSLSVAPSNVSTPPTSQASTTSSTSASSTATLPNTSAFASTPSHASSSTSSTTTEAAIFTQVLPHAHPPTHTSAPHLISDSHYASDSTSGTSLGSTASNRTNRSPKRTFDESEIEDVNSGNGRVKARSRLSGPDRGGAETNTSTVAMVEGGEVVVDPEGENLSEEQEVVQALAAASTNPSPSPKHCDATGEEEREEGYESDSLSTSSSSLTKDEGVEPEESGTPTTSLSNSPASSSHQIPTSTGVDAHTVAGRELPQHDSPTTPIASTATTSTNNPNPPTKSQISNLPGKAALARKQKREVALGAAAATAVGTGVGEDRRLTRRQRKTLGLPKVRRMAAPYDRQSTNSGARGGARKEGEGEGEGDEWKRNGTGRVDVRGFRELRI